MSADYDKLATLDGARAQIVRVSDVESRELEPLWPGVLWRGKVSLLCGDPGLGKSQLSCDVAARVSRATEWPCSVDKAPQGDVLMLSAEDDVADTLKPRLQAAGADLDRIHFLSGILVEGTRNAWPSLSDHVEALRAAVVERPSLALIVIDPISAYLSGVDTHRQSDVRAVLGLLAQLAMQTNVCVLAISHLNKTTGGNSLYRVTGSLAFVAAARSAYVVARDPHDPDARLMLCLKNNLAREQAGYRYAIKEADSGAPYIEWSTERVTMTVDEALAPMIEETPRERGASAKDRAAQDWLRSQLAGGAREAATIWRRSERDGITARALKRAARQLGIEKQPAGFRGAWHWALPPELGTSPLSVSRASLSESVQVTDALNGSGIVKGAPS